MSDHVIPSPPRPRRRFSALALAIAAVGGALVATAASSYLLRRGGREPATAGAPATAERWQCPMHPSVVQDHPGECPICGMKLVKMQPEGGAAPRPGHRIVYYRSPMNPKQTSPTPKKDEMGMDYIPVYEDELAGTPSTVEGRATVDIDPARQQLIGLRTAEVTVGEVGGAWRTTGRVAMDETRVRHVNLKVPGFVERVYVNFVGKKVEQGDALFSVYSPELLAAEQEYLLALQMRGAVGADGEELVKAARRKLSLWDVPKSELERLERTGEASKTITFRSPVAGVVTKKDVVEGMKLDAGAMPYEIVDLSTVWVLADVYEAELRLVREGMPATLTLAAYPNRSFEGKVLFIDPILDPQTRTVKVRLAFPNPAGDLRPEMFGEVVLRGNVRQALRIPLDAVIDSGTKKIVFVALGAGKFQPREIALGESDGTFVEVVSGLEAGQQVVTRANFLIDSESALRASLAAIQEGGGK